jgi:8-oxo-dGTP diphosphatase
MTDGPRIRVAGLLINGGRVLLVRQQKDGRTYWLLPGGGVEEGEELEDALLREITEECGLPPTAIRGPIALAETIPPAETPEGRHILHMVFAIDLGTASVESFSSDDAAVLGHAFVAQQELAGLDLRPPIHDYLRDYRAGDAFVSLGRMWVP